MPSKVKSVPPEPTAQTEGDSGGGLGGGAGGEGGGGGDGGGGRLRCAAGSRFQDSASQSATTARADNTCAGWR